jgi:DNA polymerase III subunit delta
LNKTRSRRPTGSEEVQREIENGKRVPCYLLYGEEDFERDALCSWLMKALAPDQARDFNIDVFRGEDLAIEDILRVCSSYPLMAAHRLVVLRGCEKLSAEVCRKLEAVVDAPLETTVLVAVGGKIDMRRRFFQRLAGLGRAVEFRVPFDNQLPEWIQQYARRRGVLMDGQAADLLRIYVGGNLRELASEIDKLAIYIGAEERITRKAVEEVVGASRSVSIFELTNAIGSRDYRLSLVLIHRLLDQGEEPVRAISMVCRHFQLLLRAQRLIGKQLTKEEMAAQLGISPYFLGAYLDQARNCPASSLWGGLSALLEADSRLKMQGRRQERLIMDLLIQRLGAGTARHKQT